MWDLDRYTDAQLEDLAASIRYERLRRAGKAKSCVQCGEGFVGRADARFCSPSCRVASHRARKVPSLPSVMTSSPRWTSRQGKRPTQVDGSPASSTDPSTWTSYDRVKGKPHGFMLGGGIGCWDLDGCLVDGVLSDEARAILDAADPIWCEISMSGKGLHIFVKADEAPGRRDGGVEFYSRSRFIAVTGNQFKG